MQYLIKIRHPTHDAAPFPYEADSPYFAARSLAAESDYEPHDRIEIEVNDGRDVYLYEVYTHPPYEPRLLDRLPL